MDWRLRSGYKSFGTPADPIAVLQLEAIIGVKLPEDYRNFLLTDGGGSIQDACAPCDWPTPFGEHVTTVLHAIKNVNALLDSTVTPQNMICIGYGHFGATTCLSFAGRDHSHVYSLDTEMRFYWDNRRIEAWHNLDEGIREFFRLRDEDDLPQRPWGYENCYHVAASFNEFLSKLHKIEME